MYADHNSSIVKIAGKNSFVDEAYNESLNISAANALSERASAKGAFISRFALKPELIASLDNENLRRIEYNLNYALLSRLDHKAKETALSLGRTQEEQEVLYSELKHRYFRDYAKWQETVLENSNIKTTEDAISLARKMGISEEVINISQDINKTFGAFAGAKQTVVNTWDSTIGKPVSETLQYWKEGINEVKEALSLDRNVQQLDQTIRSILINAGFKVPQK